MCVRIQKTFSIWMLRIVSQFLVNSLRTPGPLSVRNVFPKGLEKNIVKRYDVQ